MTSPRSQRAMNRSRAAVEVTTPPSSPSSGSSAKEAAKKRSPTLSYGISGHEMVTIEVIGADGYGKTFTFHKCYICHYSPFFYAAFNGRFSEGASQSMVHDTVSIEAFGIFATWIYNQKIEDGAGEVPCIKDLANLWIVADVFLIPALQNMCVEALNDQFSKIDCLPTLLFGHVYENTKEDSPLRRMFVDLCLAHESKIKMEDNYPPQMLIDIANASKDGKPSKSTKLSKDRIKKYFVSENAPGCR